MKAEELARARTILLGLPEATEQEAWGAPTFRVRKRMFAMIVDGHHAEGRTAAWLPAPVGAQRYLVDTEPERFFVPPYVGPRAGSAYAWTPATTRNCAPLRSRPTAWWHRRSCSQGRGSVTASQMHDAEGSPTRRHDVQSLFG